MGYEKDECRKDDYVLLTSDKTFSMSPSDDEVANKS